MFFVFVLYFDFVELKFDWYMLYMKMWFIILRNVNKC